MAYIIFSKFLHLKPEKQERILNAAMKEFAQNGYRKASTDTIVKEAAISKGALFHYFNNKKDLYLFLFDYAMDILKNGILVKLNYEEKDVFERRRQAALLKMEILKKHPEMYDFLTVAYFEDSPDVKSEMESRIKVLIEYSQGKLNEGVDTSKFRDDIDVNKAIDIITWTTEGFANREIEKVKSYSRYEQNINKLMDEMDFYMDMLKECFYKK